MTTYTIKQRTWERPGKQTWTTISVAKDPSKIDELIRLKKKRTGATDEDFCVTTKEE